METFLIILFALISLIQNLTLMPGPLCYCTWKENNDYYYCAFSDGTRIKATSEYVCNNSFTFKCTNNYFKTKEECEKSYEWVEGKCYRNIKDKDSLFLWGYKNEQDCEKQKADWTMKYCSFKNFTGNIYNQIKNVKGYDNEQYDQTNNFTKDICEGVLNGNFGRLNGEKRCFFKNGQTLNKYFCRIIFANIDEDEICPLTMDSEECEKLGGNEYGECSIGNVFGEAKDECKNLSKNKWKKEEGFCYDNLELKDKKSCEDSKRGEWIKLNGIKKKAFDFCTDLC